MKIFNKWFWLVLVVWSMFLAYLGSKGRIDQDFFSYYYVGQGIVRGEQMYGGFTDNKGPVLYLFYFLLAKIFDSNLELAYVLSKVGLGWLIILGLGLIATKDWPGVKKKIIDLGLTMTVTVAVMESVSLWGIYAENLGMVFVIWAVVMVKYKRYFWGGVMFGLGILSRQTLVLFGVYLIYLVMFNNQRWKKDLGKLVWGTVVTGFLLVCFLLLTKDFTNFVNNSIIFNLNYVRAVKSEVINSWLLVLWDGGLYGITLIMLLVTGVVIWQVVTNKTNKVEMLLLVGSTFLSTFVGGLLYTHHFYQFYLIAFFIFGEVMFKASDKFPKEWILVIFLTLGVYRYVDNLSYERKGGISTFSYPLIPVAEIEQKKFMQVVSFYPKLYFGYKKDAPNKYFNPFYISDYFNIEAEKEREIYKKEMRLKLKDTAFVLVKNEIVDEIVVNGYLDNFEVEFGLVKKVGYNQGKADFEVYWSER